MGNLDRDTLVLFPCCARKSNKGTLWDDTCNPYSEPNNTDVTDLLKARASLLNKIKRDERYCTGKYVKNASIKAGPEFGQKDGTGSYLPAIERYRGVLYTSDRKFANLVIDHSRSGKGPHLLILSALYGLLRPLELIQDYNLQMGDKPARSIWREYLPSLLKTYIETNDIKRVRLYFGLSTEYFRIACHALEPLWKRNMLIDTSVLEVESGSTYYTPYSHGLHLAGELEGQERRLPRKVIQRNLK